MHPTHRIRNVFRGLTQFYSLNNLSTLTCFSEITPRRAQNHLNGVTESSEGNHTRSLRDANDGTSAACLIDGIEISGAACFSHISHFGGLTVPISLTNLNSRSQFTTHISITHRGDVIQLNSIPTHTVPQSGEGDTRWGDTTLLGLPTLHTLLETGRDTPPLLPSSYRVIY